ncbi:hypothetical protein SDC9_183425 [bioreactor metagenome]|uniref:Uncharacterized protein n=1 Tax=bioreactor metagenome TaxID=1076179 RepID=A0A645HC27_9ZZZZ
MGDTVIVLLTEPLLHSNAVPLRFEETVRTVGSPKQITDADSVIVSTGFGNTVTVTAPVVIHPSGLVTVTL